ncbi:hypothetical protein HK102_011764 [Quaeritorhiza haematococci]|nr:hypothetical protein HK102_011764 [Quaeritorhiza haematococci]
MSKFSAFVLLFLVVLATCLATPASAHPISTSSTSTTSLSADVVPAPDNLILPLSRRDSEEEEGEEEGEEPKKVANSANAIIAATQGDNGLVRENGHGANSHGSMWRSGGGRRGGCFLWICW